MIRFVFADYNFTTREGNGMRKINCFVAAAILGLTLSACQKEEGPAEKAGKEADKAMKEAGQAMEKAADSVKEATKGK